MSTVVLSTISVTQAESDLATIRDEIDNDEALDACDRLDAFVEAVAERFPQPEGFGNKIDRRDLNGKRLRIGDTVKVYNSARYGNPTGVLIGEADGVGTKGKRVTVRLDSGQNDSYTPSVGRVERLVSAKQAAVAA